MSKGHEDLDMSVNYWSVFTDAVLAMLLLLVLFIFAQFLANTRILARLMVEQRQNEFAVHLKEELGADADAVEVVVDGNSQRIRFSDAILFDRGDDQLKETGERVLRVVGERLLKHPVWVSGIQIEGHTDRMPIRTSRFQSNWELSSARATSVVRFLHDEVNFDPEVHPLAATGRGEYVPLAVPPPGTEEDDREAYYVKNRRVEMILTYSEKDLYDEEDAQRQFKEVFEAVGDAREATVEQGEQSEDAVVPAEGSGSFLDEVGTQGAASSSLPFISLDGGASTP